MPYRSLSEARIKKLDGAPLTLAQVNLIARIADGIPKDKVKSPWAVAISSFKKSHKIENGKWVKKKKKEEVRSKSMYDVRIEDNKVLITKDYGQTWYTPDEDKFEGLLSVKELDDGRYEIIVVSTAALRDMEGETYSTECIDYDIKEAQRTGKYPEFRLWHKRSLGVGRVTDMKRVGIFAVDKGPSYDDLFSIHVCKDMLTNNDGTWKASRGFLTREISGSCPSCGESLIIRRKHLIAGFRCPVCNSVHMGYKGVLKDVRFRKARTFDVTITDNPAVPWTSAAAFKQGIGGLQMTKKELKSKLLDAGIPEDVIDARLKDVTDAVLKELDDLPEAEVLKELDIEGEDGDDEGTTLYLDPETLKEFNETVKTVVKEEISNALADAEVQIPDVELDIPELKELISEVGKIKETLDDLVRSDEERLKEMMDVAPRAARFRLRRYKAADDDEEDEDEDEDEEDLLEKQLAGGLIVSGDGKRHESMSAMIMEGRK